MKGRLLGKEEILKLKEGEKVCLIAYGSTKEQIGVIRLISTKLFLDINTLNNKEILKDYYITGDINKILRCHNIYEHLEESKRYTGVDILHMIKSRQLKVGDELIGYMPDGMQDGIMKIVKNDNGYLQIININDSEKEDIDSWDLINMTFCIKEKEYLTFDEARMSNKSFKYKDWNNFYTIDAVLNKLRLHSNDTINWMLSNKLWEIEP